MDFKASVKGHVHPRRLNVPVINLSTGGMLFLTDASMEIGEMLEARLPVPTLEDDPVTCKVVHRADAAQSPGGLVQVGCTFVSPDPTSVKGISDYILERLKELGPEHSPFANQHTENDATE